MSHLSYVLITLHLCTPEPCPTKRGSHFQQVCHFQQTYACCDVPHSYFIHICCKWLPHWLTHALSDFQQIWVYHFCDQYIETRRIYIWDMTHWHMRHDSLTYETWLIDIWDMTHWHMRHDSLTYETWLSDIWDMTHWHLSHDAFAYGPGVHIWRAMGWLRWVGSLKS